MLNHLSRNVSGRDNVIEKFLLSLTDVGLFALSDKLLRDRRHRFHLGGHSIADRRAWLLKMVTFFDIYLGWGLVL